MFGESILDEELRGQLLPKPDDGSPGLTDVCREILLKEGRALTASKIYRLIQERFPSLLAQHKVPVSSVTTVLNRLVKYGEVKSVLVGKRRAWQWITVQEEPPYIRKVLTVVRCVAGFDVVRIAVRGGFV